MKPEINLNELTHFILEKKWFIIILSVLGLGFGAIYTFFIAVPQYESTTQLLVDQRRSDLTALNTGDINANIQLIETYKELITGPAILENVKKELNSDLSLSELASRVSVEAPNNVQIFNITATEQDPILAADMVNSVAEVFSEEIQIIMPRIDNVAIIYEGTPSAHPVSPKPLVDIVTGLAIGFFISFSICILQHLLDGTLRTHQFITDEMGWNNLGSIDEVMDRKQAKSEIKNDYQESLKENKETLVEKV